MPTYEKNQATGSRTQIIYCKETDWGVSPSTGYREQPVVGGETLDDNVATYESKIIRSDRMKNPTVRGTRRPGGSFPFELSAKGIGQFFWHALGGRVWTTPGALADANEVQTITVNGTVTGGYFKLSLDDEQTGRIAYDASAATVRTALAGLANIGGTNNVTVSGTNGGPFTVTFQGDLAATRVSTITASNSLSGTGTNSITVAVDTAATTDECAVGLYKHIIRGSRSLPVGFTLEKGFLDLTTPEYMKYAGCRISGFTINGGVDQIVGGNFDILSRESAVATNSVSVDAPTVAPNVLPFTSVQAAVYNGTNQISVCQSFNINFSNNFNDNSFVLGSNFRQNLKPGDRSVGGSANFLFDDMTFYNAAMAGTNLDFKIVCTDASSHSVTIRLPEIQLLPQNSSPKITDAGPLTISSNWQGVRDSELGSDIVMTIINDESSLEI